MNTATTNAVLTPSPVDSVAPRTIDSGMPSSTAPSTMPNGESPAWSPLERLRLAPPIRSMAASPRKKTRAPAISPKPTVPLWSEVVEGLLDEVEGHGADQHTGAERHRQPQHA